MVDILNDVQKGLSSFFSSFKKKPTSVIGVDIGSSAIKVVQLKSEGGRVVLETYGAVALGTYGEKKSGEMPALTNEQIATAIADVLREANITTKSSAVSLQSSASLIFVIQLPNIKESEYETVIPTEARKYIPVPLTEVSLDWWVIPEQEYMSSESSKPKGREVLVVAVRNETLGQYRDLVKQAQLDTNLFELEIFSIIRSSFGHELEPVVVVDFGARSTRVAIVEYGIVRVFHTINRGSHHISQTLATSLGISFEKAEDLKHKQGLQSTDQNALQVINTSLVYIFSEINSVLLQYEREYHKSIGRMIVAGGGSRMPGFFEKAKSQFPFEITPALPFEKTTYPEFLKDILLQSGPEFAVAIGLALKRLTS